MATVPDKSGNTPPASANRSVDPHLKSKLEMIYTAPGIIALAAEPPSSPPPPPTT